MTPEDSGWRVASHGTPFGDLLGPFLGRRDGDGWRYAVVAEARHANNRGVVHGGMLLGFADHAIGLTVWQHIGRRDCATIDLGLQFIDAVRLGELVEIDVAIVRATRSVVFVRGDLRVGTRLVATANGIWKILASGPVAGAGETA